MEIFQNSIIKLIVRQGPDNDRSKIILGSGELGYTTDTERLFVGNGYLSGGNVVGNLFKGRAPTITDATLWPATEGDLAFSTDKNKLYVLTSGNGSSINDWSLIGGVYSSGNNQISISDDNIITLNAISAGYISNNALSNRFSLLSSGKLELSPISAGYISNNALSNRFSLLSSGKLELSPISAGYISSDAVSGAIIIQNNRIMLGGDVPFQTVSTKTITSGTGLNLYVDGELNNNTPVNALSSNITITSNHLYARYDGISSLSIATNGLECSKLSSGHYQFIFDDSLPTLNYIPIAQILGYDLLSYQARVINTALSSCDVVVVDLSGGKADTTVVLHITY